MRRLLSGVIRWETEQKSAISDVVPSPAAIVLNTHPYQIGDEQKPKVIVHNSCSIYSASDGIISHTSPYASEADHETVPLKSRSSATEMDSNLHWSSVMVWVSSRLSWNNGDQCRHRWQTISFVRFPL